MRYDDPRFAEFIKNFDSLPDGAAVPVPVASIIRGEHLATTWRRVKDGSLSTVRTGPNSTRILVGQIRDSLKARQ